MTKEEAIEKLNDLSVLDADVDSGIYAKEEQEELNEAITMGIAALNGKIDFSKEVHNKLVDAFEGRAKEQGLKGKAYVKAQLEFFLGASVLVDIINGERDKKDGKSCIHPMIWICAMRGDKITKYEDDKS